MTHSLLLALGGTSFTALMTAVGAATVFLIRTPSVSPLQPVTLGFAAGVMLAASIWSLLIPAIQYAEATGLPGWLPAVGGAVAGICFLMAAERFLPSLNGKRRRRTPMLVLAVTLHNIPEGMAVGISFALAAQSGDAALLASALALAIGIGVQNFPEGAAISLPLHQDGMSRGKAFRTGAMSGIVEPIFGVLTALAVGSVLPLMPWLLSFAAGAMLFVAVEELIPEANLCGGGHRGTLGFMAGFLLMMILDVALG